MLARDAARQTTAVERAPVRSSPAPQPASTGEAPAARRPGADRLDAALSAAVLQRTMQPTGANAKEVHELLRAREAILPEGAGAQLLGRLDVETVARGLARLEGSAYHYRFHFGSDQSLALLYHELLKHVRAPEAEDPATEVTRSHLAVAAENEQWETYRTRSPDPHNTYELVFVGAGAATAYQLESWRDKVVPDRTLVIGPEQPWAEERGPGFINHPMHMISPDRSTVGLGDETLAARKDFSEVLEGVLKKYAKRRMDKVTKIVQVRHDRTRFYEVQTPGGNVYARDVVSALGIGPHDMQGQDQLLLVADDPATSRALDLDTFQRRATAISETRDPASITIAVVGGNAGIDAVMTAMRKRFRIIWIPGMSEPGLLPGTDNERVKLAYDARMANKDSPITEIIKGYGGAAMAATDGSAHVTVEVKNATEQVVANVVADYAVIAKGPRPEIVRDVLDESVRDRLVPMYDVNRQFRAEGLATVVGLEVENADRDDPTSLQVIGGSAFRIAGMADAPRYDYLLRHWHDVADAVMALYGLRGRLTGMASDGASRPVVDAMRTINERATAFHYLALTEAVAIQHATAVGRLPQHTDAPDFAALCGPLLELLDNPELDRPRRRLLLGYLGSLRVLTDYGAMLAAFRESLEPYLVELARNPKSRKQDPRKAGEQMRAVIDTLPSNILVNDQLTPTRSEIEAGAAYVPDYVLTGDVNFASDSATVLAIYIAANFPHIPDRDVDMWVDRIVRWRRPDKQAIEAYPGLVGPLPNPLTEKRENAAEFAGWFKKRLREENEAARQRLVVAK
jgi:hypothetical protein